MVPSALFSDHTGEPSAFLGNVDLNIGSQMKRAYMPAWPANEDALVLELCFKERTVQEAKFKKLGLNIGDFEAFDNFWYDSFCLLNAPGVI